MEGGREEWKEREEAGNGHRRAAEALGGWDLPPWPLLDLNRCNCPYFNHDFFF